MRSNGRMQKSRRRWLDALCVALWIGALALVTLGAAFGVGRVVRQNHRLAPALREVALPPGGTLWGLALRYRAPGQDPRAVAAQIRRLNGLQPGRTLHPGTRLLVPDYARGATELAQNSHEPG